MALSDIKLEKNNAKAVYLVNADGAIIEAFGGGSSVGGGDNTYSNVGGDFSAVANAATKTITFAGLPFTLDELNVINGSITKIDSSGNAESLDLTNVVVSGNVLTLGDIEDFVAGDEVLVTLVGFDKAYDQAPDAKRFSEIDPLNEKYLNNSVDVDTTNVSASTHYYPSSTGGTMDSAKDQSLTGKLIDADGILTLTLEVTNDEDAAGDWNSVHFYDDELNATVNNKTVTNGTELLSLSVNNNNFRRYRWALVASGATNTVILKERKKAL